MSRVYVGVIGGSEADEVTCERAFSVGRELARRGVCVLTGGGPGVMEAVCRGAKEAGGMTVAFLPGNDRKYANEHVDVALPTGMGEMRNMLLARASDALIAVGGEFGTLSEIGFGLRIGKPVVGLQTWELSKAGELSRAIAVAEDARDAVEIALRLVQRD